MEGNLTELVTHLAFQLAVILFVAKLAGEISERYLRIPPVLGELLAGVAIGPYLLGGMAVFGFGPLFPIPHGGTVGIPISPELWSIAQIASVILLFSVGLETNLQLFLRYAAPAGVVALGGVIFPFVLGVVATVLFGFADGFMSPSALFMGAIMTATSVGITARVLSERRKLHTPEGVTILGAAVVDDVLGILALTIVVGISEVGRVSAGEVAIVGVKAFGFWLGFTAIALLLSTYIARFFDWFRVSGALIALSLALALLSAGLAESFGLAMIIGAYSIGLALSRTSLARRLHEPINALYAALVPVFFVVMGMLVNVQAMSGTVVFGVVITLLAIVSKVFGSGGPALSVGFNLRGAWRIGIGMLPRGEVALIVAGVGLSRGVIGPDLFGVSIFMTIVTTILAPIILVPLFDKGGSGRRDKAQGEEVAS
jgi:Kef-type K+ transport system membrane component KefB